MKIINLELSKRLTPYLGNIKTEYTYHQDEDGWFLCKNCDKGIKTLTLEEAIEFLPVKINNAEWEGKGWSRGPCDIYFNFHKEIRSPYEGVIYKWEIKEFGSLEQLDLTIGKTQLEAIERLLEYLLDNNLLGK